MDSFEKNLLQSPTGSHWKRIGVRHHHGINLPLFSLKSKESCGIGEYPDLIPILNWCKEVGFDVLQLLPLNDSTIDISPYSALSAFALSPLNLGLSTLPYVHENPELKGMISELQKLNALQRISYPAVVKGKEAFLRKYYSLFWSRISSDITFKRFIEENRFWLKPYALFWVLKEETHGWGWESWQPIVDLGKTYEENAEKMNFFLMLQYLCFQQMCAVKEHAEHLGVFLKGDIPILINRESADVWMNRPLFHLEFSAGAPPDMYAPKGQNWGFPLYNWEQMQKTDDLWWKERLRISGKIYHIYRLDHIVGFFRIWAIARDYTGTEGHYIPHDHAQWIPQGRRILNMMLENSGMLPIGEDLGNVPPEVRVELKNRGICGTRVMRWERYWHREGQPFVPYNEYIPQSMTTVSTHDSEGVQLWWRNHPQDAKAFAAFKNWPYEPELSEQRLIEILKDSHKTNSLFHINLLSEYLAFIPNMTWEKLEDERINVPGTVSDFNWSYRFRPTVEEIIQNHTLRERVQYLLS